MAYDRRISELQDGLKRVAESDERSRNIISNCLAGYATMRSAAVDDLVDMIDDCVSGTTGSQNRWQERVNRVRADLDRHFGDSVKDVALPAPVQLFWDATVRFERSFFERLALVQTPQRVEDLMQHQGVLQKTIANLQTNWNDLLAIDSSLESDQLKTIQELDRLVQELIAEIEVQNRAIVAEVGEKLKKSTEQAAARIRTEVARRVGEAVAGGAEIAGALGLAYLKEKLLGLPREMDPEIDGHKNLVLHYMERLAFISRTYRELAAEYRSLMSIEKGGILTMFKNTRAEVADYLNRSNLVTVRLWRDEATRHLTEWAGASIGSQREDAEEFNKKIFDLVDVKWQVTETMDKEFQSRFAGIFTSPLTSDTLETLTEKYMFRQAIDSVNARGAPAKIEAAQTQLAGSVQETVERAAQPLEEMDTDWPDELKEAARVTNAEFRKYLQEQLKGQIDLALNSLGELRWLLDPPKVQTEFSREELEAMLR